MPTNRRRFLAASAALGLAAFIPAVVRAETRRYRVAVIGHTGRGNYGHGLDVVWRDVPNTEVVAVADPDPEGLAQAVQRLGTPRAYREYRAMLDEVKPDLVAVGPRWVDQHRDMVVAAAERGARGILLEKPLCRTLAEADEMLAVCQTHGVPLALAHQTHYSPKLPIVRQFLASGQLGRLLAIRGRGKEDQRGGGEDLFVLGSHILDLMNVLAGPPQWCMARLFQEGHLVGKDDVRPGNEGIGPLAGDAVHRRLRTGRAGFGLLRLGSQRRPYRNALRCDALRNRRRARVGDRLSAQGVLPPRSRLVVGRIKTSLAADQFSRPRSRRDAT